MLSPASALSWLFIVSLVACTPSEGRYFPLANGTWRHYEIVTKILDETKKQGDDYAARVYIVIDGGMLFWRTRALNYVWSSKMQPGTAWDNAYAGPNVRMMALRNGIHGLGKWYAEKRNVRQDLQQQFGEDIRYVDAIAIMTDTDDSSAEALAFYSDIYFSDQ